MREGIKVRVNGSEEVGVIKTIIGNVAIVRYSPSYSVKASLSQLTIVTKQVERKDFIASHQEMMSDEVIRSFFEEDLTSSEVDYHRTLFIAFGVELCDRIFDNEG